MSRVARSRIRFCYWCLFLLFPGDSGCVGCASRRINFLRGSFSGVNLIVSEEPRLGNSSKRRVQVDCMEFGNFNSVMLRSNLTLWIRLVARSVH